MHENILHISVVSLLNIHYYMYVGHFFLEKYHYVIFRVFIYIEIPKECFSNIDCLYFNSVVTSF